MITKPFECHNLSYYWNTYLPSNTTLTFLQGKHTLPGHHRISFRNFKELALRGQIEPGRGKPELHNIVLVIQECDTIKIENLKINFLLHLDNKNVNIVNNVFITGSIHSKSWRIATNIKVHNTSILTGQNFGISVYLIHCTVLFDNVTISNNYTEGIYLNKAGDYSSLTNVKIVCNECLALFIEDCSNNLSITNMTITDGHLIMDNIGSNVILRNITVKCNDTRSSLTSSCLLAIIGSNSTSSHHIRIIDIIAIGVKIVLRKIDHDLSITNVYTDVALNVTHNGNHIDIIDSYMVGILDVSYNGNNISLRNITVSYTKLTIKKLWQALALTVQYCGSYISITNLNIFDGFAIISNNQNKILLQNVTIYVNNKFNKTTSKLFFDPKFELQDMRFAILNNCHNITLKNITMLNSTMMVNGNGNNIFISNIYLKYQQSYGVLIGNNKDNVMLSDINADGYANFHIYENGDHLTIKGRIESFEFSVARNGNRISVINVTSTNNTNLYFESNGDNIMLYNVTIKGYRGSCGLVFLYNKKHITLVNVTVSESSCGIYAYGSCILHFLEHPSRFINNISPNNGAGMQIGGGVTLVSNTEVYFVNNTAFGVGGAIYVDMVVLEIEKVIEYCTFQNFKPIFANNNAVTAGNDVYNGRLWKCEGIHTFKSVPVQKRVLSFMTAVNCTNITYLKNFPTPLSSHITSTPIGVCLCTNNDTTNCNIRIINKKLYPGQYITLPLVTVGICGGVSSTILVISNTSSVQVLLDSSDNQETKSKCKSFTYQLKMVNNNMHSTFFIKNKFNSIENKNRLNESYLTINVLFLLCPVGLELISKACHCNHILRASNDIQCNIIWMPYPIRRSGNIWLYYNHDYNCTVFHKYCPFDYCNASSSYLSLENVDTQCSHGRSGILCGAGKPGLSLMLGSNKCQLCDNNYLLLVIGFILAGMALVAFLFICNMTVSVGSINGLFFYANIIKLNEAALFPNGDMIPVLSQFIAWLNLDLGIETCFFNGLNGYWKIWLQYAFPIYIWFLVGTIAIGSHYSSRICRLCGNNTVPVLATLILMSYSKLLQIITKSLMSSKINCEGIELKAWSVDGNIDYLSTKHIPLFVIAMFFLLTALIYTGLVFSAQWLQQYSGKCCKSSYDPVVKLKPFIDAYNGPYKDKYRFWTGFLLILRLVLTPVFSYTANAMPQVNNYIITFISAVSLYLSRGIYRYNILNVVEAFYLLNLGLLTQFLILSGNMGLDKEALLLATTVSISLSFTAFIGSVLVHIYIKFLMKKCLIFFSKIFSKKMDEEEQIPIQRNEEHQSYSPAHVIMRRESMIFDFSITDEL